MSESGGETKGPDLTRGVPLAQIGESDMLEAVEQGEAKGKANTFTFRGREYKKADAKSLT